MSDSDGKKTLGLRSGPRSGQVKQSFSHGRTKNVVVETKRKRVVVPKSGGAASATPTAPVESDPSKRPAGITDAEMARRMNALKQAKSQEVADTARREAEEKERAEDRERRRAEIEAKEQEEKEREERTRAKAEAEERTKREAELRAAQEAAPAPAPEVAKPAPKSTPVRKDRERDDNRRDNRGKAARDDGRRSGKLTLNQALAGGDGGRQRSLAAMKRKQERARQKAMGGSVEREKIIRDVQLPEAITVQELANRMAERVADVVKSLMNNGIMATQNQSVDADTAELIIEEFGHKVVRVSDSDVEDVIDSVEDRTKIWKRARRSSPLWATSTTARLRFWMRSAMPKSWRAKLVASPSTSAPIRSIRRQPADFPRHAWPRGLYIDACTWCSGDGYCRSGGCR